MGIMTEAEAKTILDKVIKLSTADECTAQLTGSIEGNIRISGDVVLGDSLESDQSEN